VLSELVCPPKNRAQVDVPFRQKADGTMARLFVSSRKVHSNRSGICAEIPVPKMALQVGGEE